MALYKHRFLPRSHQRFEFIRELDKRSYESRLHKPAARGPLFETFLEQVKLCRAQSHRILAGGALEPII